MKKTGDERQPGAAARHSQGWCVLHIVPGLDVGGAEMNLLRLVRATATPAGESATILSSSSSVATRDDSANHRQPFHHQVVNLGQGGALVDALQAAGAQVLSIDLARRPLGGLRDLYQLVRGLTPDVIQGWLYKGNFLASVAGLFAAPGRCVSAQQRRAAVPVLWSIRHSLEAWDREPRRLRLLVRALGRLPFAPSLVLYNAQTSQQTHADFGYQRYPSQVLSNFLDFKQFRQDGELRRSLRNDLNAGDEELLVGFVGRDHPLKNIPGFLQTAQQLQAQLPNCRFVLAGAGLDETNAKLQAAVANLGLRSAVQLLGPVEQPERLYNGLDLLISPSLSEGASNVLLEATACGCACVATNVGAAGELLPSEVLVVPAADASVAANEQLAQRLAQAALPLLSDSHRRACVAEHAKRVVHTRHNTDQVAAEYLAAYRAATQPVVEAQG